MSKQPSSLQAPQSIEPPDFMTRAQRAGRRARILREIEQARRDQPHAWGRLRRLCEEFAAIESEPAANALRG